MKRTLVPKLRLGTPLGAKLCFAGRGCRGAAPASKRFSHTTPAPAPPFITFLLLTLCALMRLRAQAEPPIPQSSENQSVQNEAELTLSRGLSWLQAHQNSTGSWGGPPSLLLTARALLAFELDPHLAENASRRATIRVALPWLRAQAPTNAVDASAMRQALLPLKDPRDLPLLESLRTLMFSRPGLALPAAVRVAACFHPELPTADLLTGEPQDLLSACAIIQVYRDADSHPHQIDRARTYLLNHLGHPIPPPETLLPVIAALSRTRPLRPSSSLSVSEPPWPRPLTLHLVNTQDSAGRWPPSPPASDLESTTAAIRCLEILLAEL